MSTVNVGSMSAGLGLDLTEFQNGMKRASEIARTSTGQMSAEMKRQSRDGTESLRIIDEAIGLHISRPLTRAVAEMPVFGKALQAVLGPGLVFGAIGVGVFDFVVHGIEEVSRAIDKAKKAQDEYAQSTLKLKDTFAEAMGGYAKSEKSRGLSGIDKKLFEIDSSSLTEAKKHVDALTEAAEKNAAAALKASGVWSHFLAGAGDVLHAVWSSTSTLGIERMNEEFKKFKEALDEIAIANQTDPFKGLRQSLDLAQVKIADTTLKLAAMKDAQVSTGLQFLMDIGGEGSAAGKTYSKAEVDAKTEQLKQYIHVFQLLQEALKDNSGSRHAADGAAALERQRKAAEALQSLYRDMGSSLAKIKPETNPFLKFGTEIAEMRIKAENDFVELGHSATSALSLRTARENLKAYEHDLDQAAAKARQDADIFAAQAKLPKPTGITGPFPITLSTASRTPELHQVETEADKFKAFTESVAAQNAVLQKAFDATPEMKVELATKELNFAFGQLSETLRNTPEAQQAYRAALDEIQSQSVKAQNAILQLQTEMQKLQEKSNSAAAGIQAAFKQMQLDGMQNGKFTFDILSQGVTGFENAFTKSLTMVSRNNYERMLEMRRMWSEYFISIEDMALKFAMKKAIGGLVTSLSTTSLGKKLSGALSGTAPGATLTTAATTLSGAGVTLNTAGTNLLAAAQSLSAGNAASSAGAGSSDNAGGFGGLSGILSALIPHAGGGDVTPGQGYLVGENGPEPFFPGSSGTILPNSALRDGGSTHVFNIDARGADAGVEQRVLRAAKVMADQAQAKAVWQTREIGKRLPR